jgi:hypothetical protein
MFNEELLKKEIETDFKYCKTKEEFKSFRHICYGMVFGVANFWCKDGYETEESKRLVKWWEDEMLPKFNKAVAERG